MTALARYAPRYRLEIGEPEGPEWLRVDRILELDGPELTELLKRDDDASGHVSAHANALSLMSFYAGRAPAAALLLWALEGHVLDVRPHNLWVKPHDGHGLAAVAIRSADYLPGGLETLYDVVLRQHLLPLSAELHRRTRAGLRQVHGGVAAGCAMAFCAATREEEAIEPAYLLERWQTFVAKAPAGLARLGDVTQAGGKLVYLRQTCCLYYTSEAGNGTLCGSCCLTPRDERLAAYEAGRPIITV
ncbi:(2Fe-2S)-binding protein [Kribbella sandramycini]|uniref:(2Fe-2S)-binding protein n=1 Tax=Kribbella sandramycini TaxID=60450 RepID=A0A7Y4L148_9ACTN|nr:(2Fe-2S)-binding protein [Kribbella sandramycini]